MIRMSVLIDTEELGRRLAAGERTVLIDVRWKLGDPHGHEHYLEGHLPGAVYADLETELSAPPSPAEGRHPLPAAGVLQAAARRWGVSDGDTVVAYDDLGNLSAARAWWVLRWAGLADVRLLDGGLSAWTAAGGALEPGEVTPPVGDVTLRPGALPALSADDAAALAVDGMLLDARAGERFRGETEPLDPRAGHIPGALSAPTAENLDATGTFLGADQLRERFAALGVDGARPVGVYCGSGVTAAHELAALAVAGIDATLYPGSWSQWSADPDRPAATGP